MGKNPEENYQIVNLLMTIEDFGKVARDLFFATEEAKKKLKQKKMLKKN